MDASVATGAQLPADGAAADAQTLVDGGLTTPRQLVVAVYVPRAIGTCFIGEACDASTADCIGLRDDSNALVEAFTAESMAAVRTSSARREGVTKEVCSASRCR